MTVRSSEFVSHRTAGDKSATGAPARRVSRCPGWCSAPGVTDAAERGDGTCATCTPFKALGWGRPRRFPASRRCAWRGSGCSCAPSACSCSRWSRDSPCRRAQERPCLARTPGAGTRTCSTAIQCRAASSAATRRRFAPTSAAGSASGSCGPCGANATGLCGLLGAANANASATGRGCCGSCGGGARGCADHARCTRCATTPYARRRRRRQHRGCVCWTHHRGGWRPCARSMRR